MLNRYRAEKGIGPVANRSRLPRLLLDGMRQIVHHAAVKAQRDYIDDEVERFRTHLTAKMKEVITMDVADVVERHLDYMDKAEISVSVVMKEASNARSH